MGKQAFQFAEQAARNGDPSSLPVRDTRQRCDPIQKSLGFLMFSACPRRLLICVTRLREESVESPADVEIEVADLAERNGSFRPPSPCGVAFDKSNCRLDVVFDNSA